MDSFTEFSVSVVKQCELIDLNRSNLYYEPIVNQNRLDIKNHIQKIYEEIPIYGYKKVHCQLLEDGYNVSANTVLKYRKELGLKAILAVKAPCSKAELILAQYITWK